jgi:hypothetical protein
MQPLSWNLHDLGTQLKSAETPYIERTHKSIYFYTGVE